MKKLITALFFIAALTHAAIAAEDYNPRGPLRIKNQMPMYLFFLSFTPDKAEIVDYKKLEWELYYHVSNIIIDKVTTNTEEYIVQIDTEVNKVALDLRYGLLENTELSVEIPYIHFSKGFLDGFIQNFEDLLGFVTTPGARENADKYQYKYEVRKDGVYAIRSNEPHGAFGDTVLTVKHKLLDERYDTSWPTLSVRGALKIPTGSESELTGSDEWETGISILGDKSFGHIFTYANINMVFIQEPEFLNGWDMKNYIFSTSAAAEYFFTKRFSSVFQWNWNSTPFPTTGTHPLDNNAVDIALGLNYDFKKAVKGYIFATENVRTDSSPDFGLGGGVKVEW